MTCIYVYGIVTTLKFMTSTRYNTVLLESITETKTKQKRKYGAMTLMKSEGCTVTHIKVLNIANTWSISTAWSKIIMHSSCFITQTLCYGPLYNCTMCTSLRARPSHVEGLVNLHTYKFEIRRILAEWIWLVDDCVIIFLSTKAHVHVITHGEFDWRTSNWYKNWSDIIQ